MTNFKIVSCGWACADWLEQTLSSVEKQSVENWDIWITYDPSADDGADRIRSWCDSRDSRWHYTINTERKHAVRNQYESIIALEPNDDDIIVWLDLDGDMLAHREVLANLGKYYSDGTLVTYGSYQTIPRVQTSPPAVPFPPYVVRSGTYRKQMATGICCFNHLRTMKGVVFKAIPPDQFRFVNTDRWYTIGTDYIFMAPALELADGRYKFISEVLLLYNHDNPHADYLTNSIDSFSCVQDCLARPPLRALYERV